MGREGAHWVSRCGPTYVYVFNSSLRKCHFHFGSRSNALSFFLLAQHRSAASVSRSMPKTTGWVGDVADCATALKVLFAAGALTYGRAQCDSPDERAIVAMTPGLLVLFALIPDGNCLYSTFVKAILELMTAELYGGTNGGPLRSRKKKAEDQALILRNVCQHIRREWYRKSKKSWMLPFPRPDQATGTGGLGLARAVPITPSRTRVGNSAASDDRSDNASALLVNSHGASWNEMDSMFGSHDGSDGEGEGNEFMDGIMSDDDGDDDNAVVWLYGFETDSRIAWRALVDCKHSTQRISPYK